MDYFDGLPCNWSSNKKKCDRYSKIPLLRTKTFQTAVDCSYLSGEIYHTGSLVPAGLHDPIFTQIQRSY